MECLKKMNLLYNKKNWRKNLSKNIIKKITLKCRIKKHLIIYHLEIQNKSNFKIFISIVRKFSFYYKNKV